MEDITLEALIREHKSRIDRLKYKPDPPGCIGFSYYYYEDNDNKAYQTWLAKTKRYLGIHFCNDKDVIEFETISKENISPSQQQELLSVLEAFLLLPTVIPNVQATQLGGKDHSRGAINVTTNINNSNSQSQSQEQSLAVDLFLEAIKDDLTGRQIKDLKAVVTEADNNLEKARPSIIEKLKSFGADVTSNIVANLLTNPAIWRGL